MTQKTRQAFSKILSLTLAAALMLTMLPGGVLTAKALNGLIIQTSNGGSYQSEVSGANTVITLLTSGNYNISGSATDTEIIVQYSASANITLNNVTIYGISSANPMYPGTPALYITSSLLNPDVPYQARTSQANLTLVGTNKLVGGNARPGIGVPKEGTYLSINGSGSLEVDGTSGGAGIGGAAVINSNEDSDCGEVYISGATVIANGSTGSGGIGGGAGIGGSSFGDGGKVTIRDNATVTATGGALAAGIGGGSCILVDEGGTTGAVRHGGDGGSLLAWGASVKATGGAGGSGIGGGGSVYDQCAGNGSAVTIYSGTVQAIAGGPYNSVYGYGMGGGAASDSGSYGSAGSYKIMGGSVYAKGVTSDKNFDATPTNGSGPVYMTTLRIPKITAPTMVTSCSTYTLGGSKTDSSGFLYLYMPTGGKSMDIAVDGMPTNRPAYRFTGTVDTSGSSWLKIAPIDQTIFVNSARWDGTGNMATTFSYNGTPVSAIAESANTTFHYTGTNTVTNTSYDSNIGPTDCGAYQVQVISSGDDSFYPILSSYNVKIGITITPKSIYGCTVTFGNPQSTYKYNSGNPVNPSFAVMDGGVTLPNYNYNVVYSNNTDIAASTDTNPPTVALTGKGNYAGSLSASYTIEEAPSVTVSADPTNWTSGNVTLKADVTIGSSGLGNITMTKASDSSNPQVLTNGVTVASGATEYTYSAANNDTYTFTVTDGAGYTASNGITVGNMDAANPVIGTVSGNPIAPTQSADLSFSVSAASGIKNITVSRQTASNIWEPITGASVTQIDNHDGSYTCSYHTTQNGTYRFTVTNGADTAADSNPVTVTQIDTVQPVLSVNAVSGGNSYTSGSWVNQPVELTLSDAAANLGTTTYQYRLLGESAWQAAVNGIIHVSGEGTTQLQLQATSAAGITSSIVGYNVKIDTSAPVNMDIHFSPAPFKTIAHFGSFGLFFGDTVNVTFTADDGNNGSGIDHYEYQVVNENETFDANGSWQTSALSISPDFKGTIYARAVDNTGNVSGYVAKSLVADKTAPTLTANGGDATFTTIDRNAFVPVTVTDNGAGVGTVTYQVNGGSLQTVDVTSVNYDDLTRTYSFSIGSLPDGNYDVTVNAQDNAGNTAQTVAVHVKKDSSPTRTDTGTGVTVDLSGCTLPDGVTSVSLGSSSQTPASGGSAYTIVVKLIGENQALGSLENLTVYDLSLLDQNGNPVKNFTGKIKVKIPIPAGLSGDLRIFWYDTDKSALTDMRATQEDGYLVFETSHFSYYAIAQLKSSAPAGNPNTGTQEGPVFPAALLGISSVGVLGFGILRRRRKSAEDEQR